MDNQLGIVPVDTNTNEVVAFVIMNDFVDLYDPAHVNQQDYNTSCKFDLWKDFRHGISKYMHWLTSSR
jgi:hypothetical protein